MCVSCVQIFAILLSWGGSTSFPLQDKKINHLCTFSLLSSNCKRITDRQDHRIPVEFEFFERGKQLFFYSLKTFLTRVCKIWLIFWKLALRQDFAQSLLWKSCGNVFYPKTYSAEFHRQMHARHDTAYVCGGVQLTQWVYFILSSDTRTQQRSAVSCNILHIVNIVWWYVIIAVHHRVHWTMTLWH